MYDIVIVGAGPAGLTSAIYARRAGKKVLLLEANNYGGQIINTLDIENYPSRSHISGFDFATELYNQAKELGTEVIFERVTKINNYDEYKEVITNKNNYTTKTIILATGATARHLSLPNENELIGKGVSYCATCDGAFYKDKNVAVVGGGNTAVEEALYLTDIAKKVYLICHDDNLKAEEIYIDKLRTKSNIKFIYNSNVTALNGQDKLTSIELTNNQNEKSITEVDGLFIAIGRIPENGSFKDLINLDKNGYIIAKENCHTNIDGIFVAGDNRTKEVRQLVTATSDGCIAALEAIKYLNNK